jgi:hypothetical protein
VNVWTHDSQASSSSSACSQPVVSGVRGSGSVLAQVIEALEDRQLNLSDPDLRSLDERAAELAIDLKTIRQALAEIHGRIRP